MIILVLDALSWALILAGSAFVVIGALGLVRMPDLYTRMHAASVTDTLGVGFLMLGMILQAGFSLVSLKLLMILVAFFFIAPVVTHALARACLHEGIEPMLSEDHRKKERVPARGKQGRRPSNR